VKEDKEMITMFVTMNLCCMVQLRSNKLEMGRKQEEVFREEYQQVVVVFLT